MLAVRFKLQRTATASELACAAFATAAIAALSFALTASLERGYLTAPSLEEPYFITAAHSREDLEGFAAALAESIEHCLANTAIAA